MNLFFFCDRGVNELFFAKKFKDRFSAGFAKIVTFKRIAIGNSKAF